MMLIGKTANWLLRHSIQRCVKSRNEFVHMREITQSVKVAPKCLIAVVLVDVNLPYWTSEVEHLVAFAAIVSNILPCMHRNGCLGTSGKIYDTIFGSSTPISLESAKFWRFGDVFHWFLDFISWKFAIFLLLVYFTYYYYFWCWYDHPLPTYCVLAADALRDCDLDFWPFDLDQLSYMAGHVINTSKKLEDPMPVRSWVMSYNVFYWLLLKMRFDCCTRAVSRDLCFAGKFCQRFWNHQPGFVCSPWNFSGSTLE